MKVSFHETDCDEDELLDIPEDWIPVRLEHNGCAAPARMAFTRSYLEESWTSGRPSAARRRRRPSIGIYMSRQLVSIAIYINGYMGAPS